MKTMNKTLGSLLGALMLVAVMSSGALALSKTGVPKDVNGIAMDFGIAGSSTGIVDRSATAGLLAVGQGWLFDLCYFGTGAETAGKGAMAFDTSVAGTIVDFAPMAKAISPIVYAKLGTASATAGNSNLGCWAPPVPKRFYYGLVVEANDSGGTIMADYRLDASVNP